MLGTLWLSPEYVLREKFQVAVTAGNCSIYFVGRISLCCAEYVAAKE